MPFFSRPELVRTLRRLVIGIVGAYLFASLCLGGTGTAQPTFYGLTAAWSVATMASPWLLRGPRQPARVLQLAEVLGFNLALTLLLAEGSLRLVAVCSGQSLLLSDSLEAHRLKPGQDYGNGLRGNALGYPGPELTRERNAGVYRIAALGDSFAVGPAVPFDSNFLTVLGHSRPEWEVYNFGVSGTGPREYGVILRQHVWAFRPDLVLLCLFVGNDITESLATPRDLDPRNHALYLLLRRGWQVLAERGRRTEERSAEVPDRVAAAPLSEAAFSEIEARRLAICYRELPAGMEKKWQRALGYLEGIVADCRAHQVPLACVLIPDEFQVNPEVLARALTATGQRHEEIDLGLPQRRLLAFFAEHKTPCLDLLLVFTQVPDTYALRDTHWNIRGNRLAATAISDWLATIGGNGVLCR
jgi:hypothetical protein